MSVCCERCVLSGIGLCDGLITRAEESYRLWCIVVCDLKTSWMRRPWSSGGCCAKNQLSIMTQFRIHILLTEYHTCSRWFPWHWVHFRKRCLKVLHNLLQLSMITSSNSLRNEHFQSLVVVGTSGLHFRLQVIPRDASRVKSSEHAGQGISPNREIKQPGNILPQKPHTVG